MKLVPTIAVLFGMCSVISYLCYKIGETTASATLDATAFKAAIREEIEMRFKAEHQADAAKTAEIQSDVAEAKHLATRALTKRSTAVLLEPKKPVPVEVVTPEMTPTPWVEPSPTRKPKGGLLW